MPSNCLLRLASTSPHIRLITRIGCAAGYHRLNVDQADETGLVRKLAAHVACFDAYQPRMFNPLQGFSAA